ncbi:MAG: hypothetical protein WC275_01925 [Bacilli bacterium]
MAKKHKKVEKKAGIVGAVGLGLVLLTAAIGFLSSGFMKWDGESWKEKIIPVKEPVEDDDTDDTVSEDVSLEEEE